MTDKITFFKNHNLDDLFDLYVQMDSNNIGLLNQELFKTRLLSLLQTDYKVIIALDNEKIIGFCGISYGEKLYCGAYLELHHMVVSSDYRGQGVGEALIQFIKRYARLRDIPNLKCDCYLNLTQSHQFYEKNGLVKIGYHFHHSDLDKF